MNTENNLLQTREEEDGAYEQTLVASEFIDWLLQEGEIATREEAEQLGRRLLEHGIIQHGGLALAETQSVLSLDYRTVSDLILTGPRTVVMEVMEEVAC
ncbi:hypothetical protein CRUP_003171 [Coryphaenoides rupestris]|nr:hypothetical protein CRUP_003171 [Coryphaenoides rupestris]